MNHLESRGAVLLKSSRASTDDKLAIVEALVACEDLAECASRCTEWLGEHAGVDKALCLVVDSGRQRLIGLGGWGVSPAEVERFSLELEDRQHPFITALARTRPVALQGSFSNPTNHAA